MALHGTPGQLCRSSTVKSAMDPSRVVIMVPDSETDYGNFRAMAKSGAGLVLPEYPAPRHRKHAILGAVGFVTFGADWRAKFVKMPKAARRGTGDLFDGNVESGRAWTALAQISSNAGLRVRKPPRNWLLTLFDIVRVYAMIMLLGIAILVGLYFAGIFKIDDRTGISFDWPEHLTDIFSQSKFGAPAPKGK